MWNVAYSFLITMGPQGIGKTIFVQTIVNDSIELETIATPTKNNVEDYNIADEHRCCPSQERDGQLEEVVVLTSFIGQLYQSFVWMFIYSVFNICRHMNELLIMGLLLWRFFITLFSYTLTINHPTYVYVKWSQFRVWKRQYHLQVVIYCSQEVFLLPRNEISQIGNWYCQ